MKNKIIEKSTKELNENKKVANDLISLQHKKLNVSEEYTNSLIKEDNRAHIEMDIFDKDDIFSNYNVNELDPAFLEYIDSKVRFIKKESPISIDIKCDNLTDDEKDLIRKNLHNSYALKFESERKKIKNNRKISAVLFFFGLLVMCVYITISHFSKIAVLSEVISIISWVFIWEAVDLFFFQTSISNFKSLLSYRLFSAEINYVK